MRRILASLMVAGTTWVPALRADAVERPSGRALELLEQVGSAHDAEFHAKQLVVTFGARESAALLDVTSSRVGRSVHAESGGSVTRTWAGAGGQVGLDPEMVIDKYAVAAGSARRLLGVELVPLTFQRRSDGSLAERWWVQASSGVVYKREMFDARGDLAGLTTITDMEWGEQEPLDPMSASDPVAGSRRAPVGVPTGLAGGYRFWRGYDIDADGRPTQHWVYSDGVHALSIFRTPGDLQRPEGFDAVGGPGSRLWAGPGPGTWAWEGGGDSWVVVAEEVGIDPRALIEPFPSGGRSFPARLGSVWSRLFRSVTQLF